MEGLEEWEVLPDDGFLEIHDDDGKKIFSRKYATTASENVFKNYFICPSPKSSKFVETTAETAARVPNQLVPIPIQLEPALKNQIPEVDDQGLKQVIKAPFDTSIRSPKILTGEADQDLVSQVFFKKMKETELFADMKLDSPKSNNNSSSSHTARGIKPQIDAGAFQFEEKADAYKAAGEALETTKISSPRQKIDPEGKMIKMDDADNQKEVKWEENHGGLNILKWSLTGIGAICSFGVATVCILVFGGVRKNKQQQQQQQNQKLQFHIYTEDKRLKRVVHHATKLNEAISAVRGVPITRARITVGGYYDGL
ncbi:uncharacterized protein [Coffea arabica]|uniref:DUF6821 domain-containing protein n=1 Tax=Coffea arabica TaxID=13443 RepID=A0A6P6T277_COFAR|nr:uncharacterized protein LOC113697146 [Coffea arabica]